MKCLIIASHLLIAVAIVISILKAISSLHKNIVLSDHILNHFIIVRTSLYRLLIYHLILNAHHVGIQRIFVDYGRMDLRWLRVLFGENVGGLARECEACPC